MTSVAPTPEAVHPPEAAGEGVQPVVADGRDVTLEASIEKVYARSTLVMPTPALAAIVLGLGLVVLFLPASAALVTAFAAAAVLVTGFALDVAGLPRRLQVLVGRELPKVFSLGHRHDFKILVTTTALGGRGSLVQVGSKAFEILVDGAATEPAGGFPRKIRVRRGRDAVVGYQIRPRVRGRHHFRPVILRFTGKLGIASRRFVFYPDNQVRVYPDLDDVKRAEMALRRSRFLEAGLRTKRFIGEGTEFESLRDYHPDDDIRHINWHATARHRKPITNQYRVERNQTVITLIDCGRLMSTPVGEWSRLDIALANAAGIAYVCGKLEDRIGAVAFDSKIVADLAPRRGNVEHFLAALFDVEPTLGESDFELAFANVASSKRALVMIFTDILEEGAARPLIAALPALVRRHQVLVASVRDPEIDAAMATSPVEADDAYRQAAAVEVLARRESTIRAIRSMGADVVEAPPDEMTPALINEYLRLKAKLRL